MRGVSHLLLRVLHRMIISLLTLIADLIPISHHGRSCELKNFLLRLCGMKISTPAFIDRGFRSICASNITIESCVSLGHDNHIWAFTPVIIRHHTITAKDLLIISASHDTASFEPLTEQDVDIGPGCWIGARVTILGGVKIGRGCIIGAGSLVRHSIPDWSIAAGVPAKVIRQRAPSPVIWNHFGYYSIAELDCP
jgi:acetyltransferase-like isoleucine patch superfamily enzyme